MHKKYLDNSKDNSSLEITSISVAPILFRNVSFLFLFLSSQLSSGDFDWFYKDNECTRIGEMLIRTNSCFLRKEV